MFVLVFLCFVLSSVGGGLCKGLISGPKESFRVSKYTYIEKHSRVLGFPKSLQELQKGFKIVTEDQPLALPYSLPVLL
jgi:hypothetical protein